MSYTLTKPTDAEDSDARAKYLYKDRPDFIVAHQGMTYAETDTAIYFLEDTEELQNGVVVDISSTDAYKAKVAAAALAALVGKAQAALDKSDTVVTRCYAAAVALPSAWLTYRAALRSIVNGTDTASTALPTKPDYPSGT